MNGERAKEANLHSKYRLTEWTWRQTRARTQLNKLCSPNICVAWCSGPKFSFLLVSNFKLNTRARTLSQILFGSLFGRHVRPAQRADVRLWCQCTLMSFIHTQQNDEKALLINFTLFRHLLGRCRRSHHRRRCVALNFPGHESHSSRFWPDT